MSWWCSGYGVGSNLVIMGLISGPGVIRAPRSTQPSIPPGYVNRVPALLAGVKAECVRLCWVASNTV